MRKQSAPSKRDLDHESIKRRTELFIKNILPHKGMIFDICIQYTKQKQYIEDNYSDVLVTLFRYIESYNPRRSLKSWIYISVIRQIFESNERYDRVLYNSNVVIDTMPNNESSNNVSCNCLGMDNYQDHYSDDILAALDKLPDIHKEVLLLQQAGYKVSEIVEITFQNGSLKSKSSETIKSRLFLAKRGMQKFITPKGSLIPDLKLE